METFLIYGFAAITLIAAALFVYVRQPVYAALSFAVSVLASSGLYLMQHAPFVAAANIVVYAGATIIIFLFVLMFAQQSRLQAYDLQFSNLAIAAFASACLAGLLIYAAGTIAPIHRTRTTPAVAVTTPVVEPGVDGNGNQSTSIRASVEPATETDSETSTVAQLGREMYTRYLWAIELAGTLLLVATIGAILIANRDPNADQTTGVSL